jgi:hypothetical protein
LNRGNANPKEVGKEYGAWLRIPPSSKRIEEGWNKFSTWGDRGKADAPGYPNRKKRRDLRANQWEAKPLKGMAELQPCLWLRMQKGTNSEFPRGRETAVTKEQFNEAGKIWERI